MIRPMTARTPAVRLVLAALVTAFLALGCGAATTSPAPATSAAASDAPPSIDAASCVVTTPPGPGDQVPDPGEIDTTDLGAGRWRLCLAEPASFSVEGTAWCTWSDDRTSVREAMGLPLPIGSGGSTVDGGVVVDAGEVYVASNDPRLISSWQGGPDGVDLRPEAGGKSGTAIFRIPAIVDQESPPPIAPPTAAGVLAWQCAEAPAPRS